MLWYLMPPQPLAKFIAFSANDHGCSGRTKDLILNCVHPLFLKAKNAAIGKDNLN